MLTALLAVDIGRVFVLNWTQFEKQICLLHRCVVSIPLLCLPVLRESIDPKLLGVKVCSFYIFIL